MRTSKVGRVNAIGHSHAGDCGTGVVGVDV